MASVIGVHPPAAVASRASTLRRTMARTVAAVAVIAAGAAALNAGVIAAATPKWGEESRLTGDDAARLRAWEAQHPGTRVTVAKDLSTSSLMHIGASGTVFGTGQDHILIEALTPDSDWTLEYVLAHESHHVRQLNVVERRARGLPDPWNPAATGAYYLALARLSSDLDRAFEVSGGRGIELAADCHAMLIAEVPEIATAGGAYAARADCTPSGVAAAIATHGGDWPTGEAIRSHLEHARALLHVPLKSAPNEAGPPRSTDGSGRP